MCTYFKLTHACYSPFFKSFIHITDRKEKYYQDFEWFKLLEELISYISQSNCFNLLITLLKYFHMLFVNQA